MHIFHKLGFPLPDQPIAAFQADKYKKHNTVRSALLAVLSMPLENAESLRDMIAGLNADPLLRQVFEYAQPVHQPQLSCDLQTWDLGLVHQILQGLVAQAKRRKVVQGLNHLTLIRELAGQDFAFVLAKQVVALDFIFKILNPTTYLPVAYGYCPLTEQIEPGIKTDLAYNVTVDAPLGLEVISGNVHDSTQFDPLLSGVTRVLKPQEVILTYDKAYYKIARFDEQGEAGYFTAS